MSISHCFQKRCIIVIDPSSHVQPIKPQAPLPNPAGSLQVQIVASSSDPIRTRHSNKSRHTSCHEFAVCAPARQYLDEGTLASLAEWFVDSSSGSAK